jgi:hypothetical protein
MRVNRNSSPTYGTWSHATTRLLGLAKRGTLKLDLSEWTMVVPSLGGGMVRATVKVTPSGATETRR